MEEADGQLAVHWLDGQPASQDILDLFACNSSRKCQLKIHECMVNGLKCTDMCTHPHYENQVSVTRIN